MNITFDIFVLYPGIEEDMGPEEFIIFKEIHNTFQSRLNLLNEEMVKEEELEACCVMIHFLPPTDGQTPEDLLRSAKQNPDNQIRISVNGYSTELTERIMNSITQQDIELLNERLVNNLGKFMN